MSCEFGFGFLRVEDEFFCSYLYVLVYFPTQLKFVKVHVLCVRKIQE